MYKNGLGYHAQTEEKQWPVSPELKKASFKTGWLMKAQQQTKFKCKESIQSQARYLSLFSHVSRVSLDHRCFFCVVMQSLTPQMSVCGEQGVLCNDRLQGQLALIKIVPSLENIYHQFKCIHNVP